MNSTLTQAASQAGSQSVAYTQIFRAYQLQRGQITLLRHSSA